MLYLILIHIQTPIYRQQAITLYTIKNTTLTNPLQPAVSTIVFTSTTPYIAACKLVWPFSPCATWLVLPYNNIKMCMASTTNIYSVSQYNNIKMCPYHVFLRCLGKLLRY